MPGVVFGVAKREDKELRCIALIIRSIKARNNRNHRSYISTKW